MAKLTLKGNTLFDGATAVLKAADGRGREVLQIIADNSGSESDLAKAPAVALTYSVETNSWVDNRYKHVLFVLDKVKSAAVMKIYLSNVEAPTGTIKRIANTEFPLSLDSGVALTTNEGNLINMNELKDRQTGKQTLEETIGKTNISKK